MNEDDWLERVDDDEQLTCPFCGAWWSQPHIPHDDGTPCEGESQDAHPR